MCVIRRHFRWVQADSRGNVFFVKYGGLSGGFLLSGGGIIIFRVIRRHFLAAAVDPAVSLSTTVLFPWKSFLGHVGHAAEGNMP